MIVVLSSELPALQHSKIWCLQTLYTVSHVSDRYPLGYLFQGTDNHIVRGIASTPYPTIREKQMFCLMKITKICISGSIKATSLYVFE